MNDFERIPPQDLDAEQSVLGAMLLSASVVADVINILRNGADFYRPAHETIYNQIVDMYSRGRPIDPITLADNLREAGDLDRIGGIAYLHVLVNAVPSAATGPHYADIVRNCALLRRALEVTKRTEQAIYEAKGDPTGIVEQAQAGLADVFDNRDQQTDTHIASDMEDYLDRLEQLQKNGRTFGIPTGFMDLDDLTGGLHPGQLVVIAARPAIGKSTVALDILRSCTITHQQPAAFFSLEMDRDEIRHRLFSAQAKIALHHMRHQEGMTNDDWTRFARVLSDVTAAPLHIDAEPNQTPARIQARCRTIQQTNGLRLVVIDYLQLMQAGTGRRTENRQQEVADMTRSFKLLAKELGVPVVLLAQLNRGPEQRQDKKPIVSDLRESGAIEQDADIVILLHREDAYDKESPRAGEADLIVGKHRNGPTATITVAFQGHYSRFVDMAQS